MVAQQITNQPQNVIISAFPKPSSDTYPTSLDAGKPKITIRHGEPEDREDLYTLLADPQVVYWTAEMPFAPQAHAQDLLSSASGDRYTLVACNGSEVVGMIVLTVFGTPRMHHVGRIGPVAVRSDCQGQGIGSQLMQAVMDLATNWLNLMRVELIVYSDNDAAIRLYSKYGFQQEGVMQRLAFRAGQFVDGLMMAHLNDWSMILPEPPFTLD
jgi:putative acetyltransferase